MRIAIAGVSHWHASIYYRPVLADLGVEFVAFHDPNPEVVAQFAPEVTCPRFTDLDALLDTESPDLVFAHAPHADMTAMAAHLVARHQPFHMEKPMGVDWRELEAVAVKARTEGVWNAVALVSRCYGVIQALKSLKDAGTLGDPCHYYHSLFAGPPQRYAAWGVPWMLDPKIAGGGALWNFGPHVIDLFQVLVGDIAEVDCWTSYRVHGLPIDDMATIRMTSVDGVTGIGEVSYTMPSPTGYERFFSLTTDRLHVGGSSMGAGTIEMRDGTQLAVGPPDSATVYAVYVADLLRRFQAGEPPLADIEDMVRTLRVMCAARECGVREA